MAKKEVNIVESVLPTGVAEVHSLSEKEKAKQRLEKYMKDDLRMVKGTFQFFECPGGSQRIQLRKYKGHFFDQTMLDGEEYTIPMYVARHLNGIDITAESLGGKVNSCAYPVHGFLSRGDNLAPSQIGFGPQGQGGVPVPIVGPTRWKRRFGFQYSEFQEPVA